MSTESGSKSRPMCQSLELVLRPSQKLPKKDTTFTSTVIDKQATTTVNPLATLIPGYTAPLRLVPTCDDTCNTITGLDKLRRTAIAEETSNWKWFLPSSSTEMIKTKTSFPESKRLSVVATSFKNCQKKRKAGATISEKGWFGMQPSPMTDDLKRDLALLKSRRYLDPKRFYKKQSGSELSSKFVQVGTVVEGTGEFFSSRLNNKERRANLTDEVMSDSRVHQYAIRKFKDIGYAAQQASQRNRKKQRKSFKI